MKSPQLKDTDSLYLNTLEFDPKLLSSPVKILFLNPRYIILLCLALLTFGLFSFIQLPREVNPEVVIPIVNVVTVLPGASPSDVERLVTDEIEEIAGDLTGLDTYSSSSTNSTSVVTFSFVSTVDPDEALRLTKEKVDGVIDNLPEDAEDPTVEKLDFSDEAIWTFALTGPVDRLTLSNIARDLKDVIQKASGVKAVDLTGIEEEEVVVEILPETLKTYGISSQAISAALELNNISIPAGDIAIGDLEYTLALENDLNDIAKISSLLISTSTSGKAVQLGEVANVYLRAKDTNVTTYFMGDDNMPQPSVEFAIFKTNDTSISEAFVNAQKVVTQQLEKYPQLNAVSIFDFNEDTNTTLSNLVGNFTSSVSLIFIVLALFLGIRQASTAAFTIPLTMLSSIIIMNALGLTINFLSLFSLLLALSLIGDDAIVMAQATSFYGRKFRPLETGLLVFRDFFVPIWVGTMTVVWSFIPLLLATGIIGEFIKPIPIVVTGTLLSSTAIATMINLPMSILLRELQVPARVKTLFVVLLTAATAFLVWAIVAKSSIAIQILMLYLLLVVASFAGRKQLMEWLKKIQLSISKKFPVKETLVTRYVKNRDMFGQSFISLVPLVNQYRQSIARLLVDSRRRTMVYGVVISLIIVAIVFAVTGLLKNEFFPATNENYLFVEIEGPAGWNTEKTKTELFKIEKQLNSLEGVSSTLLATGKNYAGSVGNNLGYISLLLKKPEDRTKSSIELATELRAQFKSTQEVNITVSELSGGPPAGAAFQANIKGDDLLVLEDISSDFVSILKEIPGAINVSTSLKSSPGQITLTLNQNELAERNLTPAQLGSFLRTSISGSNVSDTTIDNEDRDITVYLRESNQNLESLQNLVFPSGNRPFTLGEVADFSLKNSPTIIEHDEGTRVIRVTAGVEGTTAPELLKAFNSKMEGRSLPEGCTWDVGGANEENNKSVQSILRAMGISFFLILVTMVVQLRSFRKAFLVMTMIPLATAGVFINFTLFGIPLSFPALIGVLALFGIVVNNSIMLIEKINVNLESGFDLIDSITDGCSSRVEAIFLSSFTAIVGLIPITLSDPLWRGLGGAIIAGLSVSGLLILYLLPSLFIEIYGKKDRVKNK